jgi:hypothetical protein
VNDRWVAAGRISKQLIQEHTEMAHKNRIFIINLPDNYQGAYIFRNGFTQAISTFQWKKPPESLRVGLFHDLVSVDDQFILKKDEDLMLIIQRKEIRIQKILDVAEVRIKQKSKQEIVFPSNRLGVDWDVFLFSQGHFHRVSHMFLENQKIKATPLLDDLPDLDPNKK